MLKTILSVVLLGTLSPLQAAAEFKTISESVVEGWQFRHVQDTAPGQPPWCIFKSPAMNGNLMMMLITPIVPRSPDKLRIVIGLANPSWQLGPNSAGQATVEIVKEARLLDFKRLTADEAHSELPQDDEAFLWGLSFLIGQQTSYVLLPNGERFVVPAMPLGVFGEASACIEALGIGGIQSQVRSSTRGPAPPRPTRPSEPAVRR